MNLYHLRYFVTLARLEHYTRASEELMITQPSLSCAINSLEEELGVRLFEKIGRNIKLTKYGMAFFKDTEAALKIIDSSANSLIMTGAGEGTIELAFLRTLGIDFVPRIIKSFLKANPRKDIRFNLTTDSGMTVDLLEGLKTKRYDVALCSKLNREPLIDFVPVASQELVLIVPVGHPLAEKDSVHLKETLPYPYIIFKQKSGLRHIVDEIFLKISAYPNVVLEVEEDQVAAGFVAHGFGIAVVPRMEVLSGLNLKVIEIETPEWERKFYIATLKRSYRAPVVEAFIQHAIDNASL